MQAVLIEKKGTYIPGVTWRFSTVDELPQTCAKFGVSGRAQEKAQKDGEQIAVDLTRAVGEWVEYGHMRQFARLLPITAELLIDVSNRFFDEPSISTVTEALNFLATVDDDVTKDFRRAVLADLSST